MCKCKGGKERTNARRKQHCALQLPDCLIFAREKQGAWNILCVPLPGRDTFRWQCKYNRPGKAGMAALEKASGV
ncbi:hypothetical protein [Bacteroides sp. An19]|uniref:hypothetical protein n=1 Tax=Bacteroides sp. An19 TaxID=1965580 RepID=UPI00111D4341|nr:hypothetical protein [Bacteroides sp. An19]